MNDLPDTDVRWKQRFENYQRAFAQLKRFMSRETLNELEEQGLIQSFEYTHELAGNVLKDYLVSQGNQSLHGSRDATREAFKLDIIQDGEGWMDMIRDRNQTCHTYNEDTAKRIVANIQTRFFPLFIQLEDAMTLLKDK